MTDTGARIVLIGGPLTTDDGSDLDSRQPVEGDDASETIRRSLANSWLWWNTTVSLTMPILEAAGPEAFALLIGERSIVDIRADGSIKRTPLRGLLPGGTSSVRICRPAWKSGDLPVGFEEVRNIKTWNGQSPGKIGVAGAVGSDSRWRFLDGNEWYLANVGSHIAPAVIIDTTDFLTAPVVVSTADGLSGAPHDFFAAARFEALERRRLFRKAVVILPHTFRAEAVLCGYMEWLRCGQSRASLTNIPISTSTWDPAAPNPVRYARPVPVVAEFRVTGLLENGQWQSPDDLEAARSLLAARFDLKIGIWDLVSNSLLRRTLLESDPIDVAPAQFIPIPPGAAQRGRIAAATKVAQRQREAVVLVAIQALAEPLLLVGWEEAKGPELLWLPLTEPIRRWSTDGDPFPLLYLTLSITKRKSAVLARTVMYNHVDLPGYVSARSDALEQIAAMELPNLNKLWPVLWWEKGGWGDDMDWPSRFDEVAAKTREWTSLFSKLADECRGSLWSFGCQ